jgi:hypothetical protein
MWPHLRRLIDVTGADPSLSMWIFGSALVSDRPRDIDVLLVYENREGVLRVRHAERWDDFDPPIDLIAMTSDEEHHYDFVRITRAVRIDKVPSPVAELLDA